MRQESGGNAHIVDAHQTGAFASPCRAGLEFRKSGWMEGDHSLTVSAYVQRSRRCGHAKVSLHAALCGWSWLQLHRFVRMLRTRRKRPRRRRAAECSQQFPPSDGDCHTPLPCEVRRTKDTTPRTCSLPVQGRQDVLPPLSSAAGSEAVSSERVNVFGFAPKADIDHKTSMSALCQSRPNAPQQTAALLDHFGRWQAAFIVSSDRIDFACFEVDDETRTWWPVERSPGLPILRAFQRRRKKRTKASKNATIRKPAISFVVRPPIWWCSMDEGATFGDPHKLLPSSGTYCGVTPRRMARRSVRAVRRA